MFREDWFFTVFMVVFLILTYFIIRAPPEEVIHLVYMLGGNSYSRHLFYTHLKSLLSFSDATLHLHIIADSENIEDVGVLLKTWNLSRCQYTFYDEKNYAEKVSWVPRRHYSKQFGYLKLEVPYILSEIDKVLILDVDLIFQVDVRELWCIFDDFNQTNFLGLAPNISPWYKENPLKWPAIDIGFNSGLELLDLRKMRSIDWTQIWKNLTKVHLEKVGANPLADQDIINAWIFENPETLRPLNCSFNFQLGTSSRQEFCPYQPKLIHFNTPDKAPKFGMEKFSEVRQSFMDKDGGVLKRQRDGMSVSDNTTDSYRILPNAYGRRNQSESCFAMYLDASKLETFLKSEKLKNATFPMVIVLFGSDAEVTILAEKINGLHREDITIHCVYGSSFNRKVFLDTVVSYSTFDNFLITEGDVDIGFKDLAKFIGTS